MRQLILTRGLPGVGKSTWIKENNLEQYTISPDAVRLMIQSPVMTLDVGLEISQKNDKEVWELVFDFIEKRMQKGEFIVVDGIHSRNSLISRYKKLCKEYKYRCTVVDFSDVPLEECLKRNKERDPYKFVPEEVIRKIHARFETDQIGGWVEIVKPEEFKEKFLGSLLFDFTDLYNKVVVFGDIHGCIEPLRSYFNENPYNDTTMYIFTGDILDRGVSNAEVFEFMEDLIENKNVLYLEGNHDGHLQAYGNKKPIKSSEFEKITLPQLMEAGIHRRRIKNLYNRVGQMAYFKFGGNVYLVTHGGLSNLPTVFTSTTQLIKGVGYYGDSKKVDENWVKNTPSNHYSIHGHRNVFNEEIVNTERTFNLCDRVEYGGFLRIIELEKLDLHRHSEAMLLNYVGISGDVICKPIKIKNDLFNPELDKPTVVKEVTFKPDNEIIKSLVESKDIQKKDLGNGIYSFNFNRDVFYNKKWNEQTVRARVFS